MQEKKEGEMKNQTIKKPLTSNQLLVATMGAYFISMLAETVGADSLISSGLSVVGLICLAMSIIASIKESKEKKESPFKKVVSIIFGFVIFIILLDGFFS